MATWKSKKVPIYVDFFTDYASCDAQWAYNTTSGTFSHTVMLNKEFHDSHHVLPVGHVLSEIIIGHEVAVALYHALANWMLTYESEEAMMEAINKNIFEDK
jgi:hypothetical protein